MVENFFRAELILIQPVHRLGITRGVVRVTGEPSRLNLPKTVAFDGCACGPGRGGLREAGWGGIGAIGGRRCAEPMGQDYFAENWIKIPLTKRGKIRHVVWAGRQATIYSVAPAGEGQIPNLVTELGSGLCLCA